MAPQCVTAISQGDPDTPWACPGRNHPIRLLHEVRGWRVAGNVGAAVHRPFGPVLRPLVRFVSQEGDRHHELPAAPSEASVNERVEFCNVIEWLCVQRCSQVIIRPREWSYEGRSHWDQVLNWLALDQPTSNVIATEPHS